MLHHLNAYIKTYLNKKRKWGGIFMGGGHTPLTRKALLFLNLVWSALQIF